MEKNSYFGFVSLLGRPNAGKSTLINSILNMKIAAVSQKPQTTRNSIVGISTTGEVQMAFVDTPGIHDDRRMPFLNRAMNVSAMQAAKDSDVLCYLVDVNVGLVEEDRAVLKTLDLSRLIIVLSKIDSIKVGQVDRQMEAVRNKVVELLDELNGKKILGFMEVSAKRPSSVAQFIKEISRHVPEGPWHYPSDQKSDVSKTFLCSELIREQVFRTLGKELPYSTGVVLELLERKNEVHFVHAKILVGKESHKPILIGAKGAKIKEIGIKSRASLEQCLETPVFLKLYVAVRENWTSSSKHVAEFQQLQVGSLA